VKLTLSLLAQSFSAQRGEAFSVRGGKVGFDNGHLRRPILGYSCFPPSIRLVSFYIYRFLTFLDTVINSQ
jgi:hypothetical protein